MKSLDYFQLVVNGKLQLLKFVPSNQSNAVANIDLIKCKRRTSNSKYGSKLSIADNCRPVVSPAPNQKSETQISNKSHGTHQQFTTMREYADHQRPDLSVAADRIIAIRACYCPKFQRSIKTCLRCLDLDEQSTGKINHNRPLTRSPNSTSSTPVPQTEHGSQYGESDSGHDSTTESAGSDSHNKATNSLESGISLEGDSITITEQQHQHQRRTISGIRVYYAKQVLGANKMGIFKLKTLTFERQSNGLNQCELEKLVFNFEKLIDSMNQHRPRRLLVFVNPFGGKGRALKIYNKRVAPLLRLARVHVDLVITEYANHARQLIEDTSQHLESQYDGIISVGGDGMFSELINGILCRANCNTNNNNNENNNNNDNDNVSDSDHHGKRTRYVSPNIPIGIIGAGSTDANAFGVYGTNDTLTAVINIILGRRVSIDVCSVHNWADDSLLRFVTTMISYGYFGDVMRDSENLRWLGPSRYDVAGVRGILKNKFYEGEIKAIVVPEDGDANQRERCQQECPRCFDYTDEIDRPDTVDYVYESGSFVGINACLMACRCPQSSIGLAPNAHLANGCVDLILVKRCSRTKYLNFLARTAGANKKSALDLHCVQTIRCREFEFIPKRKQKASNTKSNTENYHEREDDKNQSRVSVSKTSIWNADGELVSETAIRVRVYRQLLPVFGAGEPYKLHD